MSETIDSLVDDETALVAALKAGAGLGLPRGIPPGYAYAVVPEGYKVEKFQTDPYVAPARKKVIVTLHDAASFIEYIKKFGDANSRVFADVTKATFKGVLDYHEVAAGAARHCEHVASYACRIAPEWTVWTQHSGKQMKQEDFYVFIENNLPDIADPPNVLEIVRTLEATKDVKFASSIRMSDGQTNFTYEEEIRGAAQKGTLQIPEKFILGIAPFQGSDRYKLEARLRYRINNGALALWFDLLRPAKVLEEAFEQTVQTVEEECAISVLQGSV